MQTLNLVHVVFVVVETLDPPAWRLDGASSIWPSKDSYTAEFFFQFCLGYILANCPIAMQGMRAISHLSAPSLHLQFV